jgi:hypothetical protein
MECIEVSEMAVKKRTAYQVHAVFPVKFSGPHFQDSDSMDVFQYFAPVIFKKYNKI